MRGKRSINAGSAVKNRGVRGEQNRGSEGLPDDVLSARNRRLS